MIDSNQFDISHTQHETLYLKADIDDTKEISLNALVFGEGNPKYRSISKTEQKFDKGSSYSFSKEKKRKQFSKGTFDSRSTSFGIT